MKRRSSLRRRATPIPVGLAMISSPLCRMHRCSARYDRDDDVLIARTAADVSLEPAAHAIGCRIRVPLREVDGAHDHAGRAEAALQTVVLVKRLLHGM